jgi:hypothetical protein
MAERSSALASMKLHWLVTPICSATSRARVRSGLEISARMTSSRGTEFFQGAEGNQPIASSHVEQHLAFFECRLCHKAVAQLPKSLQGSFRDLLVSAEASFNQPFRPFVMFRHGWILPSRFAVSIQASAIYF